jgi:hypothetical protein
MFGLPRPAGAQSAGCGQLSTLGLLRLAADAGLALIVPVAAAPAARTGCAARMAVRSRMRPARIGAPPRACWRPPARARSCAARRGAPPVTQERPPVTRRLSPSLAASPVRKVSAARRPHAGAPSAQCRRLAPVAGVIAQAAGGQPRTDTEDGRARSVSPVQMTPRRHQCPVTPEAGADRGAIRTRMRYSAGWRLRYLAAVHTREVRDDNFELSS